MRLLKYKTTTDNNTVAVLLLNKDELELLEAMSKRAYGEHLNSPSTEKTHSRLRTIWSALKKGLKSWDKLEITTNKLKGE